MLTVTVESDGQKDNAGGVAGAALQRGNSYIGAVLASEGDKVETL